MSCHWLTVTQRTWPCARSFRWFSSNHSQAVIRLCSALWDSGHLQEVYKSHEMPLGSFYSTILSVFGIHPYRAWYAMDWLEGHMQS